MACLHKKLLLVFLLFIFSPVMAGEKDADASLTAVRTLIEQGRSGDAIALLQQMVDRAPDNFRAWFMLGTEQAGSKLFDDAVTSFRTVIALQPGLPEPHNNLAVIYNELGDLRSAVVELEASLKLNPDYATAHENIGDLYVKLAAESYKNALEKIPDRHLRNRYEYLLHIGDVKAAAQADAAKAAESPVAAPTENADAVLQAIQAWRDAWSKRDVLAYLTAYDADFKQGARFVSHNDWVEYRLKAIIKKAFIDVSLENILIERMSGDLAEVTFLQHYKSNTYVSDDRKKIKLKKGASGWKIIHEQSM